MDKSLAFGPNHVGATGSCTVWRNGPRDLSLFRHRFQVQGFPYHKGGIICWDDSEFTESYETHSSLQRQTQINISQERMGRWWGAEDEGDVSWSQCVTFTQSAASQGCSLTCSIRVLSLYHPHGGLVIDCTGGELQLQVCRCHGPKAHSKPYCYSLPGQEPQASKTPDLPGAHGKDQNSCWTRWNSWLGKAGQEEKGATEDETVGWHHQLKGQWTWVWANSRR